MKQTAVQFLFEKLWNADKDKLTWYAILDQAKAIDKEQIKDAYKYGVQDEYDIGAEQYYNETFKSE